MFDMIRKENNQVENVKLLLLLIKTVINNALYEILLREFIIY